MGGDPYIVTTSIDDHHLEIFAFVVVPLCPTFPRRAKSPTGSNIPYKNLIDGHHAEVSIIAILPCLSPHIFPRKAKPLGDVKALYIALCNKVCLDEWDSCTYQVLVKNSSDHSPILASNSLRKVTNFRFFSMWLQDKSCLKLIHDSWDNKVVRCPMFILQHKLKRLKIELRD